MKPWLVALAFITTLGTSARAQEWSQPVRGSWVRADGVPRSGDVKLTDGRSACEIVVSRDEHTAVKQAAAFLAADIETISGHRPPVVERATGRRTSIHLVTLAAGHAGD